MLKTAIAISASAGLIGCGPPSQDPVSDQDWMPEYGAVATKRLDNELVQLTVEMKGARTDTDVIAFNDCVAAKYAQIRGSGFVLRVKNDVRYKSGTWYGNGIYTLSDTHPGGTHTIDAEITAANCAANSIPMV